MTAPSIQALALIPAAQGRQPWQSQPLIVGNPAPMPQFLAALPHAAAEAQALGQLLAASPLIGTAATESVVKQRLSEASLIHLASHGFFNESQPLQGAIALAPSTSQHDGFLSAAEILEIPLQANLVVLSACDTGRGRITGDGVVGLSRSFLAAGAEGVLVSLWQIPDEATASLMLEFYRHLDQGYTPAQSLRQAMLTTLAAHPNPRDWAAFTLIGRSGEPN